MLKKTPGLRRLAAIRALALGIGANTAIFPCLNGVILRPLEYPKPWQLMKIATTFGSGTSSAVSAPVPRVGA